MRAPCGREVQGMARCVSGARAGLEALLHAGVGRVRAEQAVEWAGRLVPRARLSGHGEVREGAALSSSLGAEQARSSVHRGRSP